MDWALIKEQNQSDWKNKPSLLPFFFYTQPQLLFALPTRFPFASALHHCLIIVLLQQSLHPTLHNPSKQRATNTPFPELTSPFTFPRLPHQKKAGGGRKPIPNRAKATERTTTNHHSSLLHTMCNSLKTSYSQQKGKPRNGNSKRSSESVASNSGEPLWTALFIPCVLALTRSQIYSTIT